MKELFEYLGKLESEGWSGEVQVTSSEGHAFLLLNHGKFVYAYRPLDRAAEKLENSGLFQIPPASVIQNTKTWGNFIKLLLQLNSENADILTQHLKSDRFELFFRIFFWTNVELFPRPFEAQEKDYPELSFYKPKDIGSLLKEAKTRMQEWPKIQARVGSSKRIFISNIPLKDTGTTSLSKSDAIERAILEMEQLESGFSSTREIGPYAAEEMQILHLCNGRNSLQDLIRQSIDEEFLTLRRVLEMWDRGLILPKDGEASTVSKEAKPKEQSRKDFKLSFILASLSMTFFGLSYFTQSLPHSDGTEISLRQALDKYRAAYATYPVSLKDLENSGIMELPRKTQFDYEFLNFKSYKLIQGSNREH
ncbi:MAG: hypothetical protein COV44_08625 [Deltaproteobacteria bacterium CG11_big_fil_rev_8_21_14_0_20_45_16]|nr:MAG: hypothetical protein COV44_08625 [Deltaproteobacteria bacterium CG11_big_fil_rev_8_21_14_0_20_45_16]